MEKTKINESKQLEEDLMDHLNNLDDELLERLPISWNKKVLLRMTWRKTPLRSKSNIVLNLVLLTSLALIATDVWPEVPAIKTVALTSYYFVMALFMGVSIYRIALFFINHKEATQDLLDRRVIREYVGITASIKKIFKIALWSSTFYILLVHIGEERIAIFGAYASAGIIICTLIRIGIIHRNLTNVSNQRY